MPLTVIKSTGIDVTGNYTVNGINVSANANVANLTATSTVNFTGVSNVTLGAVGNVKLTGGTSGQYLQTDGSGNLSFVTISATSSSISNGNSNVNIPSANGNITISAVGNSNIVVITGTGVNVSGTLNVTGNANVGNIGATNANITAMTATGNISAGNANLGNLATANFFSGSGNNLSNIQAGNISGTVANANYSTYAGTVTTAAQPNITSLGTLTDINVSGNAVIAGNLTVSGTTTYVNVTNLAVADPVIQLQSGPNGAAPASNTGKDVGTALNYYDSSAKVAFMGWDVSNAEFGFGNTVSISSEVVTFTSYGNVRAGYFLGNGSQLTGVTATANGGNATNLVNGNSNVIVNANANVTISSTGNANILIVTGTGVNVNGTLDTTGNLSAINANLGNLAIANFFSGSGNLLSNIQAGNITGTVANANYATYSGTAYSVFGGNVSGTVANANYSSFAGHIIDPSQPNITSVGTLTSLVVTGNITSGNASLGNLVYANYFLGNASLLTSINGSNVTGFVPNAVYANSSGTASTVTTNAQPNITSLGTLTGLTSNGTVDFANTGNVTLGSVSNLRISGGSSGYVLSTDGSGTLSWVAQSTTSVAGSNTQIQFNNSGSFGASANLTFNTTTKTLSVDKIVSDGGQLSNITAGNITGTVANANYATYSGTAFSVSGSNVSGTVANANYSLYAGTVITASQPNITSLGTLTGLTSGGTINFTSASNVSLGAVGNVKVTGGSSGQYLQTDGAGNLTFATVSVSPSGSNTQVQFNDGGSFGSNAGLTFDKTTTRLTTNNFTVTTSANLGSVSNITITGGSANYVLKTDGAGNLSWTQQSSAQAANITVDNFTGNGVQTVFTLSTTPANINCTIVNYNGVTLLRSGYSLSGANLTFSPAPANGSYIEVTTLGLTAAGGGGGGTSAAAAVGFSLVFGG